VWKTPRHSWARTAAARWKADPENKSSEIVVSSGTAQVQRGQERIDLAQWEKATIPSNGPIQKSNVLAPPDLVAPFESRANHRRESKNIPGTLRMEARPGRRILYATDQHYCHVHENRDG